jgi:two-component system cell cycle sensor histidine kinase/response regulator CckA
LARHPAVAIIDAALPTVMQSHSVFASLPADLPLIGICGEDAETCRRRTEHLPVRAWLNKPFTASQVLRALREILKA